MTPGQGWKFVNVPDLFEKYIKNDDYPFWVYSYGSLIWYPSFKSAERRIGYVKDLRRKFSHASFRFGVPDWPGRVATLVARTGERTWGVAYKIVGRQEKESAFEMLKQREIDQGYAISVVNFTDAHTQETFEVYVYITAPGAHVVLKDEPLDVQAYQIYASNGSVWPNKVYVENIAKFLKTEVLTEFPYASDVENDSAMILATYIGEYESGKRVLTNMTHEQARPAVIDPELS